MKSDGIFPGRLKQAISADPPLWAGWMLLQRIFSKAKSFLIGSILHAPGLYLGPGCVIKGSRFIHFGRDLYVQGHFWLEAVSVYRNQQFDPRIEIGDSVSISEGAHISCIERVSIGNQVLLGSRVYISDHNHGSYHGSVQSRPDEPPARRRLGGGGPVDIGENVWIGDNVVIVGPVSIGRGSIVGANSVVRANVPEYTMIAGIPARPLRHYNAQSAQWERL